MTGSYPDTFTLNLRIPSGTSPTVILRAYNLYDLYTESEPYISPQAYRYEDPEEAVEAMGPVSTEESSVSEEPGNTVPGQQNEEGEGTQARREVSFLTFLEICLVIVFVIFVLLLVSQLIAIHNIKKRRHQRRNDDGHNRNQPR